MLIYIREPVNAIYNINLFLVLKITTPNMNPPEFNQIWLNSGGE